MAQNKRQTGHLASAQCRTQRPRVCEPGRHGGFALRRARRPGRQSSIEFAQGLPPTAHATHLALYVLFFAVPLAGWAYSSAAGFPVVLFGVLPLPDFVPVQRELSEVLKEMHATLALALAAVVLVHVAGAIKHQWVDRDGLLQRMRPAPR